jgi:dihydrofolate reductase
MPTGLMPPWSRGLMITSRFVGSFDEFDVLELRASADQGDPVECIDRAPVGLGGSDELEGHRHADGAGAGSRGDPGAEPDAGEGRLDRVEAGEDCRALRDQSNDDQTDQTNEEGTATMKLTTTTQVSVDGVMQGPGGPEEDERGRFERGGWAMPHFDNEAMTAMDEIYQRADAFLFGRRTYEIFARSWGTGSWGANQGNNPISVALNTRPKYVASTTLADPRWANTTVLSSDVAAAVRELKAKPGRELQVHGCGALFRWLLDNDLVDEMTLFICPVVVGQGTRLFPDTGRDRALELVESRVTPSGVTVQVYRPAGRPQYG